MLQKVEHLLVGDICVTKSVSPILTIVKRDDTQSVWVMHVGGYIWDAQYGTAVEVAPDADNAEV